MPEEDDFLRSLRATFKVEADEHLQVIASGLLELERPSDEAEQRSIIEAIFRAAHSLKGAARAVNFPDIEAICQSMEDVFASWKRGATTPTPADLDSMHRSLDRVSAAVTSPEAGKPKSVPPPPVVTASATPPKPEVEPSRPIPEVSAGFTPGSDTVRISLAKLDARLLQAEELLTAKLSSAQRVTDLAGLAGQLTDWHK
jgi:two-component system chemotaxis sensor kinase CheA